MNWYLLIFLASSLATTLSLILCFSLGESKIFPGSLHVWLFLLLPGLFAHAVPPIKLVEPEEGGSGNFHL